MAKTILITGASSGIGKATAQLFQSKGWNVIATMRSPEKETELTQLENTLVTRLDVLDLESISNTVEKGLERFGKIDVLLNNAGYGAYGPLESFPRENIIRQFNTNVIGLLDVTRALIPHFRQQKDGIIINVSSIGGKMAFPFGALYHGTKFAVEGISEALNYEMEQLGVRVKLVELRIVATDFGGRSFDFQNEESIEEYQPLVTAMFKSFEQMMSGYISPSSLVAEVIHQAATDGSTTLRYRAGTDAEQLLDQRKQLDDHAFSAMVKGMYGI